MADANTVSKEVLSEILIPEFAEPFNGLAKDIEDREVAIAEQLSSTLSTEEMVSLVKEREYFAQSNEHQDYRVRKLLMRALRLANAMGGHFVDLALDDECEWYVRCDSIQAVGGIGDKSQLLKLLPLVSNASLEGEIRSAALEALAANGVTEALPVIRSASSDGFVIHGDLDLACARGRLGDETVLTDLLKLANSDWSSTIVPAREALAALVARQGGSEALASRMLGSCEEPPANPLVTLVGDADDDHLRLWAIREVPTAAEGLEEALVRCLASSSWEVQFASSERLAGLPGIGGKLLLVASDVDRPLGQRLWALRSVVETGAIPDHDLVTSFGDLFTPWDFDAGSVVRRVVVGQFAERPERGTDVGYYIEWHLQEPPPAFDVVAKMSELKEAFNRKGLMSAEWKEIGEYNQQGSGECWVLDVERSSLFLNMHAPLARLYSAGDAASEHDSGLSQEVAEVLVENGIVVLDNDLLDNVVPGLNVYYFGERAPLKLGDLLFYWQD